MKFTGQVRIPEVDHPGVPATIVVEGDQTEVFLEGESLGRWSLFDVHASRLVSSAFSLALADEEITFIADEPVDFAYKGVDHMAEVWARFKSMSLPRRMVAVGRSRRGTLASRIGDLREAMLYNLESVGRPAARLAPIESMGQPVEAPSWTKRIDAYSNVPEPLEVEDEDASRQVADVVPPLVEIVSADDKIAAVFAPAPIEDEPAEKTVAIDPIERAAPGSGTARLRPGPGLIPRRVEPSSGGAGQVPSSGVARPPLADSPWDEPPPDAEPPQDDMPSDGSEEYYEETPPPGPMVEPAALVEPTPREEGGRHEVVVDLDHLEGDEGEVSVSPGPPEEPGDREPERTPVLAGAAAPAGERSGLLGAVRSAFARNRASHVHEFVEAPGGIGIVRQICAECGYISIGVTD
ncbi:MAG TPA: hypothetical protein VK990_09265 [Acidimicrobiia bacterium]|nr:hypothetical protein [Acidimicrobiia bacterium]